MRKVSRKLQVLKRCKHVIPIHAKKRLYLGLFSPTFSLPFLRLVPDCGKRNADIIEKLHESIPRLFLMTLVIRMENCYKKF